MGFNSEFKGLIHSFCSLSSDRPTASLKRVLHRHRSNASSFNFQYPLFSLRPSSSCLRLFHRPRSLLSFPLSFQRVLHRERYIASSFSFQYYVFSLRPSSSCLRLLHRPRPFYPSLYLSSEFSTESGLLLPHSVSSTISFS